MCVSVCVLCGCLLVCAQPKEGTRAMACMCACDVAVGRVPSSQARGAPEVAHERRGAAGGGEDDAADAEADDHAVALRREGGQL